jgi:hypothetical protein
MFKIFVYVFVLALALFSPRATAYDMLYSPQANTNDLLAMCSSIKEPIPQTLSGLNPDETDRVWSIITERSQCLSYLVGVIAADQIHTINLNNKLGRSLDDTTYGGICIPSDVNVGELAEGMVFYVDKSTTSVQRTTIPASIMVYGFLSTAYPCKITDPM